MLAPVIQRIAQALSPYYLAISTRLSQWFQAFMAGVRWAIGFVNGAFAGVNPIVLWATFSLAGLGLGYVAYRAIKQRRLKNPVVNNAHNAVQGQYGTLEVAEEAQREGEKGNKGAPGVAEEAQREGEKGNKGAPGVAEEAQREGEKGNKGAPEVAEVPQITNKIDGARSIQYTDTVNSQSSQTSPMHVARVITPTKNNAVFVSNGQPKSPGNSSYGTYHLLENLRATDVLTVAALFTEPTTSRNSISRYQGLHNSHCSDANTRDSLFAEADKTRSDADILMSSYDLDATDTLTDSGVLQDPKGHQSSMQPLTIRRMAVAFIASWLAYLWYSANAASYFSKQYDSSSSEHAGHKVCDRVRPGEADVRPETMSNSALSIRNIASAQRGYPLFEYYKQGMFAQTCYEQLLQDTYLDGVGKAGYKPVENHVESDFLAVSKICIDAKGASSAHQLPSLLVSATHRPIGTNESIKVGPRWSSNSYIQLDENGSYCSGLLTDASLIRCDQAVYSVYPDQVQSYVVDLDESTEQEFYTLSQYGQKTCLEDDNERQVKTVSGVKNPSSEIISPDIMLLSFCTAWHLHALKLVNRVGQSR